MSTTKEYKFKIFVGFLPISGGPAQRDDVFLVKKGEEARKVLGGEEVGRLREKQKLVEEKQVPETRKPQETNEAFIRAILFKYNCEFHGGESKIKNPL